MTEKEKAIKELQQYLRNIEKSLSDDPALIPDGIFSSETAETVRRFQQSQGLTVDGVVDFETWERIVQESRRIDKKRE